VIFLQEVSRKQGESFENLLRRFSRRILQSRTVINAKERQFFSKPLSKNEQRQVAIRRQKRREEKAKQILLGK